MLRLLVFMLAIIHFAIREVGFTDRVRNGSIKSETRMQENSVFCESTAEPGGNAIWKRHCTVQSRTSLIWLRRDILK